MANNGADIYLILLRPTRVPVAGESVSMLFQGQVLLESLTWNLHNEDERLEREVHDDQIRSAESLIGQEDNVVNMAKDLERNFADADKALAKAKLKAPAEQHADLDKKHSALVKKSMDSFQDKYKQSMAARTKQVDDKSTFDDRLARKKLEAAGRNKNFEFTFTKRVDIASTQMLNSMKAGDIFPSGTLTIHKRSATIMDGTSLVFNIQKIRLLDYRLQVAVTDTMTEMMESWTCEFGALAYVYKNPPSHYSHGNAGQAVAKTLSQGTMRAFTMKNLGSPI